jgi:crotonobetainyl-CoA:carnitine CoA-transferase CaiB-like acyl-CoA transferase
MGDVLMSPPPLSDVMVVEIASGVAGSFAGRLLSELGATVVMVEPADGHPLRGRPPMGDGHGALFSYLASGKLSDTATPDDAGRRHLEELLGAADALLVEPDGAGRSLLPASLPDHLVVVEITAFGGDGPSARWRPSDLAVWAMGGYMYFTGEAGREPLAVPGSQAEMLAGVHAAFALMAALHERSRSGRGQEVEVAALEAVLASHCWLVNLWAACGMRVDRTTHGLTRSADGWVHGLSLDPSIIRLVAAEQLDGMEPVTSLMEASEEVRTRYAAALDGWAATHTTAEIVELGRSHDVTVAPVMTSADLATNAQLADRRWWREGTDAAFERLRVPGPPFRFSRSESLPPRAAPRRVEDRSTVADLIARRTAPARSADPAEADAPALSGVRIVELATNWAAPVCARHLADLGAEVIKVERADRLPTRQEVIPGSPPDPQLEPYNRSLYFNELNRNKRSVSLDLKTPLGAAAFRALVKDADVLIENNSVGVMERLGMSWEQLAALNPGLIMISFTAFGSSGPWRNRRAYGMQLESIAGLTAATGYRDGPPYPTGLFYPDPVGGIFGAVAVMAALLERQRSGKGQWIDLSLAECATIMMADVHLQHAATGQVRRPDGNRDTRFAPQGAYRCAGEDNWVAISVQSDDDWLALAEAIGRPDLAGRPELASLAGRRAHHDELDAAIGDWTGARVQYEVAGALQRAGISSAPVLANWQVAADRHIHARRFYVEVDHPTVGVYPQASWPWRLSRTPAAVTRPAPTFAQHHREIFAELGYDDALVDELLSTRAAADRPDPEVSGVYYCMTVRPPPPVADDGNGPKVIAGSARKR